ncbi:hypothetical protein ACFWIZ_07495 [Streptomyces sp. NPDC127044]
MSLSVQAGTQSAPSPCSRRPSVPAEKALVRRERDERAARPGGAADVRFGPSSAPSSWLERMAPPGELLFSHAVHGGHGRPRHRILALTRPADPDRGLRHHQLIDIETVRAVADTVADLIDDLPAAASPARPPGAPSRQPPAPRASRAPSSKPPPPAASSPTPTPRCATTRKRSCLCHYKRKQAPCHRTGVRDSPRLDHCVPEHPVIRCAP